MDKNEIIRVLVPCDDLDNDAIKKGIQVVDELCKQQSGIVHDVILFIPSKQNIKGTSLASVLGESISNRLHKGEKIQLPSGKHMRLETMRTLKREFNKSIVLAIYADEKMMDQVDSMNSLLAIVAVPHMHDALDGWKRTWSPLVPGEEQKEKGNLISDPVVESALSSLTNWINLSHTILNPRDKEHADRTVRILRRNNHTEDPSNVRAWAVKHGWHPKAADELKKLWIKIYSLKNKPKMTDSEAAKRTYTHWKNNVK
jgi:hypothetical protein